MTNDMLWAALGDATRPRPEIRLVGEAGGLPSIHLSPSARGQRGSDPCPPVIFAVDALATDLVALATAAAAELHAARHDEPLRTIIVDRAHAAAAFRSERYLAPVGWELPPAWDPIAGDYAASDGWVRIHTNYLHHRNAAVRALETEPERSAVARAIARCTAEDVETAIVREGGAAAKLRTIAEWSAHPQGQAVAAEPLVLTSRFPVHARGLLPAARPLAGVRVLDLTRVIAGPVCTRFLAAHGADVLRLDPPGFEEVAALLPDTTAGKRCAELDLRKDRGTFLRLVAGADLLVCGYRGDALERLGLDEATLRAENPALGILRLDAYGWSGPWQSRRGFDSLVQMSTGIAARVASKPTPLPAQALDHGAGYLLAAAACRALTDRLRGEATTAKVSLARVAAFLVSLGTDGDAMAPELGDVDRFREDAASIQGPLRRVRCPGRIDGLPTPRWNAVQHDDARW